MIVSSSQDNKPIGLLPLRAIPPNFGLAVSLALVENDYSKIIICVEDVQIDCISMPEILDLLRIVFKEPKYEIITAPVSFSDVTNIQTYLPKFDVILTVYQDMYAHFAAMSYPCILLPRPIGYNEMFYTATYRKARLYDMLSQRTGMCKMQDLEKNRYKGGEE